MPFLSVFLILYSIKTEQTIIKNHCSFIPLELKANYEIKLHIIYVQ